MHRESLVRTGGVSRFIATKNPFYAISAALVLFGLNRAVNSSQGVDHWQLMSAMCGYTLLLALSGWLVVRIARVWSDARTLLLLIVLMFFAISVSLDHAAVERVDDALPLLLFGLGFSMMLTEIVLASCRITLALRYRLPYHAMLCVLFIYPLFLGQLAIAGKSLWMSWSVCAFPTVCAIVFLTLLPSAMLGGRREPTHGTPWRWPLYPWSLFVFLLAGVLLRSYWLSIAFEANKGTGVSYRPYFVIPLFIVVALLWLQAARSARSGWATFIGMLAPIGIFALALPGPITEDIGGRFLSVFCDQLASPAQLAAWGLVGFYAIAAVQHIRGAPFALVAAIMLAASTRVDTLSLNALAMPNANIVGVLAVFQCIRAVVQRSTLSMMLGVLLAIIDSCLLGAGTFYMALDGFFPIHLAMLAFFVVGMLFDDGAGRWLRRNAAWLLPVVAIVLAIGESRWFPGVPHEITVAFFAIMSCLAAVYWLRMRTAPHLLAVAITTGVCTAIQSQRAYQLLVESSLAVAAEWLAWGLIVLAIALATSFAKSGVLSSLWLRFLLFNRALDRRWRRAT